MNWFPPVENPLVKELPVSDTPHHPDAPAAPISRKLRRPF